MAAMTEAGTLYLSVIEMFLPDRINEVLEAVPLALLLPRRPASLVDVLHERRRNAAAPCFPLTARQGANEPWRAKSIDSVVASISKTWPRLDRGGRPCASPIEGQSTPVSACTASLRAQSTYRKIGDERRCHGSRAAQEDQAVVLMGLSE